MPGWTRASELDRSLRCVGSKLIPPQRMLSSGVLKAGAWGTFVHHWKETGNLLTKSEYYDSFKSTFEKKILPSRDELWPINGEHEVSYAYNCENGTVARYTGAPNEWKDSHNSQWVCGTNDYEREEDGWGEKLFWIDDLKTGGTFNTPPSECLQLYFYAMCANLYAHQEIRSTLVSITHWPKYPLNSIPDRKTHYLEANKIEKFRNLLLTRYNEWLEGYKLDAFNLGNHCLYCDAAYKCPVVG